MKKFLLFIISIFTLGFVSFAGNGEEKPLQDNQNANSNDSTSVNFYDMQKLNLYPNPVSDYLHIDYDILFVKEAKLKIYNTIGAVVYSNKLENKQDHLKISVSDYDNGLYFCSLQIDGKLLNTKKILINH